MYSENQISILVADDDPDDRDMMKDALTECRHTNAVTFVNDGEELIAVLHKMQTLPGLILLDLNMPKKDGREALLEIKSDPYLKQIAVVIMTTSKSEEDILNIYEKGGNSFVTKPPTFKSLVGIMNDLVHYWFKIVERPTHRKWENIELLTLIPSHVAISPL